MLDIGQKRMNSLLGEKVDSARTVSTEEDSISQRHELMSVKHMYKEFNRKNNNIKSESMDMTRTHL